MQMNRKKSYPAHIALALFLSCAVPLILDFIVRFYKG